MVVSILTWRCYVAAYIHKHVVKCLLEKEMENVQFTLKQHLNLESRNS